ncbi:YggT family protein [Microbacterium sp.]|uniref:YggT family protein n=1 Tax=Microbacterium sp. TaxID=51671 RepID=UPI0039E25F40
MDVLRVVAAILNALILLYIAALLARLVMDYIPLFNRAWRPRGLWLVVAEVVYTMTDPPIKLLRRLVPPLRVGGISIDFAFTIVMLACFVLLNLTRVLVS